ncbi:molybdopterin-dependent oxidoreductase [Carboxydochorda subterranea]|uniref:Molybdopterin-dependent oxidoreductase n=1 Tax=Carboxydichorda subterranea TaxID=3109565 RepID=A0ABZ1C596_9FIRM|nr:molybdopterin-dependent oxidoreductase [Limnochorda sp. L945t]WRP18973.1 molybdopterin-dependent oxidoreductase [Limnochorda sp. L945t]
MATVTHRVSRRNFVKATGALAAVAGTLGGGTYRRIVSAATGAPVQPQSEEVKYGVCRMCHTYFCATRVHVQNGIVTLVEGAKDCDVNQGALCIRGHGLIMNLYDPYRLKKPLVRTNPKKGLNVDPQWKEASWEEALDLVGKRIRDILARDPRRIAIFTGFGADGSQYARLLAGALGTPNGITTSGSICSTHFHNFFGHGTMMDRADVEYCRLLIAVGRGTGGNFGEAQGTQGPFFRARERGMRFVVVDPRLSPEAAKADEWIPIRPGTDLAFFLGMMHVILFERKEYDIEFLKHRSNAPYLIGPDELYVRDRTSNKPLVWDMADGRPKPFDDPGLKDPALTGTYDVRGVAARPAFQLLMDHVQDKTPEWAEGITTVPAATIRRLANEFVDQASIGATITIDGETFPLRPVAINVNRGVTNRKNGHLSSWAAVVLCELVGAMDVPGGRLGSGFGPFNRPDEDGTVALYRGPGLQPGPFPWKFPPDSYDLASLYPHRHNIGFNVIKALEDPSKYGLDYPLELAIFYGGSHFNKGGTPERIESALLKIPFIVSIEATMGENAMLSDVILPEHAVLERHFANINEPHSPEMRPKIVDSGNIGLTGVMVNIPAVKPLYDTKNADDIILDLAEAAGVLTGERGLNGMINRQLKPEYRIDPNKRYNYVELLERRLKSVTGKGYDFWEQHGFELEKAPARESYNYHYNPMGKTRYVLYREVLKRTAHTIRENFGKLGITMPGWDLEDFLSYYQALPVWRPSTAAAAPAEFDLYAVVWRTPPYMFDLSWVQSNALLFDIARHVDPYQFVVLLNRSTAKAKGLQDGQVVWVESPYGRTQARVRLTEAIHPEVVGFPGGLKRSSSGLNPMALEGTNFNRLVPIDDGTFEPMTGGLDTAVKVKIYAA